MAEIGSLAVSLSLNATNFNGSIAQVNRQMTAMGSELRALQARGTEYENSLTGLSQKQNILSRSFDAAGIKLEEQRRRYDQLVASGTATQAQIERQANAVNRAQADYSRLERELAEVTEQLRVQSSQWTQAGQRIQDVGGKLKSVGDGAVNVGKQLSVAVTAPLLAMGTAVTKTAMDFEAQMDRVGAIAGATGTEMDQLSAKAMELGASTSKSATEVALGMENMAAMGFEVNEIIGAMPGIISAAEASGADMAQTADVVAAALNAFQLEAGEASRVADILAQTANQSAADITDLQYAFKYAAPVAQMLGISMEELSAAVGIMADNGMRGEQAGTTLRAALLRLTDPPRAAANTLKDLGISITDAEGKMLPFSDIIGQLGDATKGMENAQKAAALSTIFGTEAVSGMLSVIEAGPQKFDKLVEGLENSAGASKETADRMKDNLKGALEELGGSIETASIQLGNTLIPVIRDTAEWIQGLVEKFSKLSPETQKTILAVGGLVAAAGPLLVIGGTIMSGIGGLVTTVGALSTAIGTAGGASAVLGSALAVLTGPVALTALGIAAIGTASIVVAKEMNESSIQIQDWSKNVSEATAEAVGGFVKISDDVGQSLSQLHLTSTTITDEMAAEMTSKFDAMHAQIVEGAKVKNEEQMESLRGFFANSSALTSDEEAKILEKRQQAHQTELEILAAKNQIVADIMKKASDEKRELTDHERNVINNINEQMKEDAVRVLTQNEVEQKVILEKMKADASELSALQAAEVVKNAVEQKEKVVEEANKQYEEAIANITRLRDETGDISAEQAERMIAEAKKSRDTTIKYAEDMHENIVSEAQAQAGEHVDQVNWETGEIKSKWEVMKTDVSQKMKKLGSDIKRDWTQAYTDAKKSVSDMYNSVTSKFTEIRTSVETKMGETKTKIETKWKEAQTFLSNINLAQIGRDIVGGLIKGIGEKFDGVQTKIEELAGKIPDWAKKVLGIKSPSRVFMAIGRDTIQGWEIGMAEREEKLNAVMTGLTNNLLDITDKYQSEEKKIIEKANAEITQLEKRSKEDIDKIYRTAASKKRSTTQEENIKIQRIQEDAAKKIADIEKKATKTSSELLSKIQKENLEKIKLYVQDKKSLEELSLEEEAKIWEYAINQFAEGTKERVEAQKSYKKAIDDINKADLESIKQYITDKKSLEELSLVEEAQIWERTIGLFEEGSKERIEAQKAYQSSVQAINKEITATNVDFSNQIQKINEDLAKQEETLTKAYVDAVDKRAQSLVSFRSLFDEFKVEIDTTGSQLLSNLQSQVGGFKEWQKEVEKLSEKAIDKGLLEELRQMGPRALGELKALNSLTDTQLQQYSALYQEKSALARKQAESELIGMKTDTDNRIDELRKVATEKLDTLNNEWQQKIKSLTQTTSTELSSLKQVGVDAGQGLLNGLGSMQGPLENKAREIAESIKKTMEDALQIKSPSRVMKKIGVHVMEGLTLGMQNESVGTIAETKKIADKIADSFANLQYINVDELIKLNPDAATKKLAEVHNDILTYDMLSSKSRLSIIEDFNKERLKVEEKHADLFERMEKKRQEMIEAANEQMANGAIIGMDSINSAIDFMFSSEMTEYANQLHDVTVAEQKALQEYDRYAKTKFEKQKEFVELSKKMNAISKADELQLYEEYAKIYEKDSEQYKYFNEKAVAVRTEIKNKLLSLNDEYVNKIQAANKKLEDSEKALNDRYEQAYTSRVNAIRNFMGMFDEFSVKTEKTGQDLIGNLQSQVDGLKEWESVMSSLGSRISNEALLKELEALGPKSLGELKALNSLSDEELAKYAMLYEEKFAFARNKAATELVGMREEADQHIAELREETAKQLEQYQNEWAAAVENIRSGTTSELKQLAQDTPQIGHEVIAGLQSGLSQMTPALIAQASAIADAIKNTIQSALDIHSPSRVMRGFGVNIGQGLVLGMDDMMSKVAAASKRLASTVEGNASINSGSYSSIDNSKHFKQDVTIHTHDSGAREMERTWRRMVFGI